MSSSAESHVAYQIGNAPLNTFPYPHFFVQDVFPQDFYDAIQANLPDPQAMLPIEAVRPVRGYKERFVMEFGSASFGALPPDKKAFWAEFMGWMRGARFGQLVTGKFEAFVMQRFGAKSEFEFSHETLLVEDITKYSLGPHTDAPRKVVTLLFYLPKDESQKHLGTSIYIPKDPGLPLPRRPAPPARGLRARVDDAVPA